MASGRAAQPAIGGFGRVDSNRGLVYQQTNNAWSTLEWKAIEATITCRNNFQVLIGD